MSEVRVYVESDPVYRAGVAAGHAQALQEIRDRGDEIVSRELLGRLKVYAVIASRKYGADFDDWAQGQARTDNETVAALLSQPVTEEPAPDVKAQYKRLLAEYHRLGDWLMAHPLEAAFMPDLLKPVEPAHSGSVATVGDGGWSWLCHDCDVDKQLPYDTAEGAIAAFQRHAKRVMGSSGDTETSNG